MKLIYIAGPYRADTPAGVDKNIEAARKEAIYWWKQGYAVFCPHTNSGHMAGECPESIFLDGDLEILRRCDIIVMLDGWKHSEGATAEREAAIDHGLEIKYQSDR